MKKLLIFLGTISLINSWSSNLIACNKPNNGKNSENDRGNKSKITPEPQKPQENSNWKNIPRTQAPIKEFLKPTNKWYFYIYNHYNEYITEEIYFNNNFMNNKNTNTHWQHLKNDSDFIWNYNSVYRWDGIGKPKIPKVDKITGKILKWNEKTDE